jgi:NADPH-dependent curcumin reductase CurA
MATVNRQWRLAARPVGAVKRTDWNFTEEPVVAPAEGQVLVKTLYLSLDPAMRGWMNEGKSYIAPVEIGAVMRAGGVGKVVESKDTRYKAGDFVSGVLNVQDYALVTGKELAHADPRLAPLPVYLSVLGLPGLTAYFGLLDIGKPAPGQTVAVSGAAGAVGSAVGQIAKIKGCRAVGIAGGPDKCRYLRDLGFDAAIDYKHADVKAALRDACPKGIDIFFDNVGGDILDIALTRLARHARVVICGAVSQYNNTAPVKGPSNYLSLLVNRATMTGMVVFDYAARYGDAVREMGNWMKAGKLKSREHIVEGLEKFPETLLMLFSGENMGKLVLKVASE